MISARNLLAAAFLAAGLVGMAALWVAWPRSSNASPLAAMFALVWSSAYLVTAVLTWRGSPLAAFAFVAAIGLWVFPLSFAFPGGQLFLLPSFAVVVLVAFVGCRYLHKVRFTAPACGRSGSPTGGSRW